MPLGIYIHKPWSEERKRRLGESMVGKKLSIETRKKMSIARLGKKLSEEAKIKLKKYLIGRKRKPFTEEHRANMSKGQKGITKHSLISRQKLSESHKGDKSPFWKGGVTPVNIKIRASFEYRLWRKSVYERDYYTCIWCGYRGDRLQADHIKPFCDYPELRFAIDNGRTLCKDCHIKTSSYGKNSFTKDKSKWEIH